MRFTIILDSLTESKLLTKIQERIKSVINNTDLDFDVYILAEGIPIDSDTKLLINILSNEVNRTPVIMDFCSAKLYPEIIKNQQSIIAIDTSNNNKKILDSMISLGALFDSYYENENDKVTKIGMSVVNHNKFYIALDYYKSLYSLYTLEHNRFPTSLLSRESIHRCNGDFEKLLEIFDDRNNHKSYIGWYSTIKKFNTFKKYKPRFIELQNISIKSFSDERIRDYTNDHITTYTPKRI